jgi:hypothetical protein
MNGVWKQLCHQFLSFKRFPTGVIDEATNKVAELTYHLQLEVEVEDEGKIIHRLAR